VFTINAKHHPGAKVWVGGDTFMVNGQRQPYIRNSRHEAKRAARLLGASCGFHVEVASVVVPVRAADVEVKQAPDDVFVVARARELCQEFHYVTCVQPTPLPQTGSGWYQPFGLVNSDH
jgi:hypothetical protein